MLKKCLSLLPLRANQQLFTSRHVYAPCFHLFNKHKIFTTQQQQCLFTATRFLKQEEIQEEIEHEVIDFGPNQYKQLESNNWKSTREFDTTTKRYICNCTHWRKTT